MELESIKAPRGGVVSRNYAKVGATATGLALVIAPNAHAAASPNTGIDYVADLVTPVKTELTLAIVAGLGLMAILMAVRAGTRLVKSFGR